MEIVGDRKFVEVPGSKNHELPPLLVRMAPDVKRLDKVMGMANDLIEQEDMIPAHPLDMVVPESDPERGQLEMDRRKMDLALNLVDQYLGLVQHWQWGDSILAWIRQCETTFEARVDLRKLLSVDLCHTPAARVSSCCSRTRPSRPAASASRKRWVCGSPSVSLRRSGVSLTSSCSI
jgi:hypothetical protein